jgi:hypothetical protein
MVILALTELAALQVQLEMQELMVILALMAQLDLADLVETQAILENQELPVIQEIMA